jgi:hypothetical protein
LLCDFWDLILYLGLYINTELFSSVSESSGFPILLDIFGVVLPVTLQVMGVFIEPFFDSGVVLAAVIRIFLSPAGIVFCFQGFFTGWLSTGLLPLSHPWVGDKGGPTITTLLLFHPGLPLAW